MKRNIFIVGSVASGKTELLQRLCMIDSAPSPSYTFIDIGQLFRFFTYFIFFSDKKLIEDKILRDGEKKILKKISKKTIFLEKEALGNLKIRNKNGITSLLFYEKDITKFLYTREVDTYVSIISQVSIIRKIIWKWIHQFANGMGGIVITGHNLKEINTTLFDIILLKVSLNTAINRLIKRQKGYTYESAKKSILYRNNKDNWLETFDILEKHPNIIKIETDNLSLLEVANVALKKLKKRQEKRTEIYIHFNSKGIKKDSFTWAFNPVMEAVRFKLEKHINSYNISDNISHFNLLLQCLLDVPKFELKELFYNIDESFQEEIYENIKLYKNNDDIYKELSSKEINKFLIEEVVQLQEKKLKNYAVNSSFKELHTDISLIKNSGILSKKKSYYIDGSNCRHLILYFGDGNNKLTFKPTPSKLNKKYANELHYLHSYRHDEFLSFGAYLNDHKYPIAWASYSRHDRAYKIEIFYHLGFEPHNILELTRAWSVSWAPKNIMSLLFGYAHKELNRLWKKQTNKPLVGISTAVNPNLGFSGSSFKASNFHLFALRPATLYYLCNNEKLLTYTTRRTMPRVNKTSQIIEAKIPQLPLNEMLMLYNNKLSGNKIFKINKEHYEKHTNCHTK